MSDIDQVSQENTLELPKFEESLPDIKPEQRKDLKYEIKHESKPSFGQSSKDLIEQYKSKFNALKQMADDQQPNTLEPSVIEKSEKSDIWKSDAELLKSPKEWDWNILSSKKTSQTQVHLDTQIPDPLVCEQEHKMNIAQHRQMILGVLDKKVESVQQQSKCAALPSKPQDSNYQNLLDKFRSAASLDDLSTFFNGVQQQPTKKAEAQSEDPFAHIEIRKQKKSETQIQPNFKTPSKSQEELFEYGSGQRTTSFFQKKASAQKLLQSPGAQFYKPEQSVTSKVTQNMNFQVDVKDHSKTTKRKEELQTFMGKLGLGKYDAPKVVINLDSQNSTIDRMRQYVNGTPISARKTVSNATGGLSDLINERQLNTTTFKQQMKTYQKSGSKIEPTGRMSADSQNLHDQSLKNLHLKLVHQTKIGNNSSGLKYARC